MRTVSLVCLLVSASLWTQSYSVPARSSELQVAPERSSGRADTEQPKSSVSDDAAVLTIKGLCVAPSARWVRAISTSPCQAAVSRKEFEKLARVIQPDMPPPGNRQLADNLPRLLVMAHEAEELGLDKEDRFQEILAYSRLQILSRELVRKFQEQAADISSKEIEEYYGEHRAAFEKVTFERILIPIKRQSDAAGTGSTKNAEDLARLDQVNRQRMLDEARQLRARAVAGDNFTSLQQRAYDAAEVTSPIPPMKFANMRRAGLPLTHLSIFDLKPGEISEVIADSTGDYIYKLDSKGVESLNEATPEIHAVLQKQRMQESMKALQDRTQTEINSSYFVPTAPAPEQNPTAVENDSDQD